MLALRQGTAKTSNGLELVLVLVPISGARWVEGQPPASSQFGGSLVSHQTDLAPLWPAWTTV